MRLIILLAMLALSYTSELKVRNHGKNLSRNHLRQCPCDQTGCPACMLGNALRSSHEQAE